MPDASPSVLADWDVEPVLDWLAREGRLIADGAVLVERLAERLVAAGAPLVRFTIGLQAIHPQWRTMGLQWRRGQPIVQAARPHGIEQTSDYIGSPIQELALTGRPVPVIGVNVGQLGYLAAVEAGAAVGARLARVDGMAKVTGTDCFGADAVPPDALWIRVIRSPHARARFTVGDLGALRRRLTAVLTAADVPFNGFGIYPDIKDQPVLADGLVRYRGEAVLALVGGRQEVLAIRDQDLPIDWVPESPLLGVDAATAPGAPLVQADKPGNILLQGSVRSGDAASACRAWLSGMTAAR